MKKVFLILFLLVVFFSAISVASAREDVNLPVPFTSEAPGGVWEGEWFNGCEEASVVMVDQYYLGKKKLNRKDAERLMLAMFAWEDKTFGSNTDTNATETARIINEYSLFEGIVKLNPTLAEIKNELRAGRPVIAPLNGFLLYGRLYGNGYHMLVLKGYDDAKQEFIVNDDGKSKGHDFRYGYNTIMGALSDFSHATKQVDGVSTAIFTRRRVPVVSATSSTMGVSSTPKNIYGEGSVVESPTEYQQNESQFSATPLRIVLFVVLVGGGGLFLWWLMKK